MGDTIDDLGERLQRYSHLRPSIPADMLARMGGGPDGDVSDEAETALDPPSWQLTAEQMQDRAVGCFLGLAVGEALGAQVEGLPRDGFPAVTGLVGGGPRGLAPGAWGDGTAMALRMADTLLCHGTIDLEDLLDRLAVWLKVGKNTVPGCSLDADPAIRAAVERFADQGSLPTAGARQGNGAVLRLAPLAICAAPDLMELDELAGRQSRATHAGLASVDACRLFASQLADALMGADPAAALRPRIMALCPPVLFVNAGEWRNKPRDEIVANGEAVGTLEAGLWAVGLTGNFRDAVCAAANLGGNASGAAAVAGQLAGALYGVSSIPEEWIADLAQHEFIAATAIDLFEARLNTI